MTDSSKKVLLIINPIAGKMTVKNSLFVIINTLSLNGYIPTVMITQSRGDAKEFARQKEDDYSMVICCGGDGTLNETISGIMESNKQVPIGYIPCGSTNDMANTLGLPRVIKKAAQVLVSGQPVVHDIGKFGDDKYFTYIASFGIFTRVSYTTPQTSKNLLGHFAYVLEGAKELGVLKSYHVKFTYNGNVVEDDFIFASISNSTSVAGIFKFPSNLVNLNDGMFELVLIKNPKTPIEISNLILNLSKQNFNDKNIILVHTNKVIVEPSEELVWTIDGECSGAVKDVVIDNIPGTIQIIQPNK